MKWVVSFTYELVTRVVKNYQFVAKNVKEFSFQCSKPNNVYQSLPSSYLTWDFFWYNQEIAVQVHLSWSSSFVSFLLKIRMKTTWWWTLLFTTVNLFSAACASLKASSSFQRARPLEWIISGSPSSQSNSNSFLGLVAQNCSRPITQRNVFDFPL